MKKTIFSLILTLMSVMVSMPASASTDKKNVNNTLPENIVVKQTTRFNDGRTLTVYFKKQGSQCEVYSPNDPRHFDVNDASKVESTNFEVVDKVEGKLYRKATVSELIRIAKQMLNTYL